MLNHCAWIFKKLRTSYLPASVLCLALYSCDAIATPSNAGAWNDAYPNSRSGDVAGCQLCHVFPGGGDGWNAYGWAIRVERQLGSVIEAALSFVELYNSDNDPSCSSNAIEINNDTQPGWKSGNTNTIFFSNGPTITNQPPPASLSGDLDLPSGPSFCNESCFPVNTLNGGYAIICF